MPKQASLFGLGVTLGSPLEGHSLWDLTLITPGLAWSHLVHSCCGAWSSSGACPAQSQGSQGFWVACYKSTWQIPGWRMRRPTRLETGLAQQAL